MKKIINGKKYDTETATLVGSWDNGHFESDFDHCSENLYRKKTGEYFLHGFGGARSIYSEHKGNMIYGSEKIIPLSKNDVFEWAQNHMDCDDYEEHFGPVPE